MSEIWGAVALGVAAVGSAVISSNGAKSAAKAQANAANNANNTQLTMYNQNRTDQTPWRVAGGNAVGALSSWYGLPGQNGQPNPNAGAADAKLLQSMPGYQFQLQQGNQAVQHDLAAKGLLGSGAGAKALTQYGQGFASNYANQYTNGLQSLAGLGQTSAAQTGYLGGQAANQIGSNQIYAGNAQATGYANQSNAINQGLSGLTGAFNQYYNANGPSVPSTGYQAAGGTAGGYNDFLNSIYQTPATYTAQP